jgi:hypothetical protein
MLCLLFGFLASVPEVCCTEMLLNWPGGVA